MSTSAAGKASSVHAPALQRPAATVAASYVRDQPALVAYMSEHDGDDRDTVHPLLLAAFDDLRHLLIKHWQAEATLALARIPHTTGTEAVEDLREMREEVNRRVARMWDCNRRLFLIVSNWDEYLAYCFEDFICGEVLYEREHVDPAEVLARAWRWALEVVEGWAEDEESCDAESGVRS